MTLVVHGEPILSLKKRPTPAPPATVCAIWVKKYTEAFGVLDSQRSSPDMYEPFPKPFPAPPPPGRYWICWQTIF